VRTTTNHDPYHVFLSIVKCTYFNLCEEFEDIRQSIANYNEYALEQLLSYMRSNKFSATLLKPYIDNVKTKKIIIEIEKDERFHRKYDEMLRLIAYVTEYNELNYVIIKHYFVPHVKMLDIDLHICDPKEILRLCEILDKYGFTFYDFRFFAHPLKLGAKNFHIDQDGEISVEIYPEIAVGRIIVGPTCDFVNNYIKINIHGGHNVKVLPFAENIYTMLTHDWYSQRIPLSLIIYAMKRLGTKDIERLIELGFEWGTIAAVYTFLKLMSYVGGLLDVSHETINKIGELIKELDFGGKNDIDIELRRKSDIMFPVKIPYTWILTSMPYHIKQLYRKTPLKNLLYDLYSHFTYIPIHVYGSIRSMFSNV